MATNPMQKKSRNAFFLGILITVLIMGAILAFIMYQLIKMKEAENERISKLKTVYVLSTDLKSGDSITSDLLKSVTIDSESVPSNAISKSALPSESDLSDETQNNVKAIIAKIDLPKGTLITSSMIVESENVITSDVRLQEYNMLKLASQITSNDYIDIRLRMPSGLDYIVISKKRVEVPIVDGIESENTIWVKLTEQETVTMSSAIVEAYIMEGAILYTAKYVEPGIQDKATPTYIPSDKVVNLISYNPNVIDEAKQEIHKRYVEDSLGTRNKINQELSDSSEDAIDNINSGVSTEVTTTKEQRKSYLDSLSGN